MVAKLHTTSCALMAEGLGPIPTVFPTVPWMGGGYRDWTVIGALLIALKWLIRPGKLDYLFLIHKNSDFHVGGRFFHY